MKSLLSVLFITGFLLFYPHQSARAEVTGAPDVTTKVPIPNLIKFGEIGTDSEGNTFLKSLFPTQNRPLDGFFGFQNNRVDIPAVYEELGTQLDLAQPFFTPEGIAVQNFPPNKFTLSAGGTLCFASDNENTQAFPIKKTIVMPAPGYGEMLRGSIYFSGYLAPNFNIEKSKYEHLDELYPNVLADITKKPECDEPPPSRSVRRDQVPTTEAEAYDVPPEKLPLYILDKWINTLLSLVGKKCTETNCNTDVNPWMNVHLKSLSPYIREIMKNTTTDPADPNSKRTGFLATFIPEQFDIPNEHGNVEGQTIKQTVGSSDDPIQNVKFNLFGAKTQQTFTQITNCSLYPDSLQSSNLNYSCNFSENDVTADRALLGGTNANFTFSDPKFSSLNKEINDATQGKIPACVLEGVKYIETGEQTDFSGSCPVNACSAAGPYQVTTGAAPASGGGWDTHCRDCGPDWKDGSEDCPDGWPGDWPKIQDKDNPSPCSNTAAAARRAVEMLQEKAVIRCESLDTTRSIQEQRTAIITAAGSYYGANTPIPRLGGCSYGEFVYKHCDSSYVCGTANVDLGVKWDQCQAQKKL